MATITTDTYLDGGVTARTAGETWTITGCTLTIRTDTRWHAMAPALMKGSLGNLYISDSLGGGYVVEGRNVRWMAYDSGTGNVPEIGTVVSQGDVYGYLLGVWETLTTAPSAVGSAMPISGFLKFREVTDGPFIVGALDGISANASSPDVTGWIEVVHNQYTSIATQSPKSSVNCTGDWFYLDNTTGVAGQTFQIPTNGGGAGTTVCGVQIETSPGSGEFEWYDTVNTTYWTAAYFNTDERNKRVENVGGGLEVFGPYVKRIS